MLTISSGGGLVGEEVNICEEGTAKKLRFSGILWDINEQPNGHWMTETLGEINPSLRGCERALLEGLNGGGKVGRPGLAILGLRLRLGEGNQDLETETDLGLDLRGVS